uniref:Uncharacterized protein n=1 Tax=Zea mays TaxID=4577 RepID=B4FGU3_MAIZE|nr:unknown [Zea mays]
MSGHPRAMTGLRSRRQARSTSCALLGWIGSTVACSSRLSTICFPAYLGATFARLHRPSATFARSMGSLILQPHSGVQMCLHGRHSGLLHCRPGPLQVVVLRRIWYGRL